MPWPTFAEEEGRLISERMKKALAAATLRKMAGEGSAEVVAGPGVQQEVA